MRVLRRFFLCPGSRDKVTDYPLSCCSAYAQQVTTNLIRRAEAPCVGLGSRCQASHQTGRSAHGAQGEALLCSTPHRCRASAVALRARGGIDPAIGAKLQASDPPARPPVRMGTAISSTRCCPPYRRRDTTQGWLGRSLAGGHGLSGLAESR